MVWLPDTHVRSGLDPYVHRYPMVGYNIPIIHA